jgi:glycosyltransferase involved in cell wall biosynthesis
MEAFNQECCSNWSLSAIRATAVSCGARRIVIPDGDSYIIAAAISLPVERPSPQLAILAMRSTAQPGVASRLRTTAKRILKVIARRRHAVAVYDLESSLTWTGGLTSAPDPIILESNPEQEQLFRTQYSVTSDIYWFVIAGVVSERKNPLLLMKALAEISDGPPVGLIVAGEVDQAIAKDVEAALQVLRHKGVQVVEVPGPISNVTFDSAIGSADCCLLAYGNEGSSGVMGKAFLAGTRILAAGSASLRRDCIRIGAQALWCELSLQAVAESMRDAVSRARPTVRPTKVPNDAFYDRLLSGTERTRVLQVLLSPRIGGAESVVDTLQSEWRNLGVESTTAYLDLGESGRRPRQLWRLLRLARRIRTFSPDVIVAHSVIPNAYSRLVAPRGTPVLTVLHSASDDYRYGVFRKAEFVLKRRTAHVVAVSPEQANQYRHHFGSGVPTTVIPNGIASGPVRSKRATTRPQLVVTIARVAPQKNPRLWLDVAKQVTERFPDVELIWYGPVENNPEMKALEQEAMSLSGISFAGPTADVGSVLSEADIVFHPSDREAHSLAILEAGAAGVPVVCAHGIGSGFAARSFEPGNAREAFVALSSVLDNYIDLSEQAVSIAPRIMSEASGEAMAKNYLRVIESVKS